MISREIIEKWNKGFCMCENYTVDNPVAVAMMKGQDTLCEGLIRTYPIKTAQRYLNQLFSFDEGQTVIFKDNEIEKLRVVFPKNNTFSKRVKKAMDLCGYFCSRDADYPYIDGWCYLNFEPKNQDDVNSYVRAMNYIYHVTPEKYMKKIEKHGLIPSFKNKFFAYPERIYFFIDKTSPEEIYGLKQQLKQNNEKYCLLVIDVSKIPNNVSFYLDPNYTYGVYTKDNIPFSAIVEAYEMID